MYTFHIETLHFELQITFDGILYHGFQLLKKHKEQLIIPEMVSSNSFYDNYVMLVL